MSNDNWWEDESTWEHVGYVEFGHHSIHEFEVYKNKHDGSIATCYHDDPYVPGSIEELKEMARDYSEPKYARQLQNFYDLLIQLNLK